ncbi:MAG: hypothetical protein GXO84_07915 [Chlorobi bacterium]|nr:hypothetical protein [Chlorobiota bacterium]
MAKIRILFFLFCLFFVNIIWSQTIEINGVVKGVSDVENIHVINKTSNKFTTTNKIGGFKLLVKLNDTLVFSSIQYKLKSIVVSSKNIKEQYIVVNLTENVNVLDEVIVGKVLTGNLDSDINNSEAERPIDFYDVGIPGYTGKPKTQNERRLYEADHGKFINGVNGSTYGLGFGINFNKILNRITGRTKKLKSYVRLESNDVLLTKIKSRLTDNFFKVYTLDETLRTDFFYFCSEDKNFEKRCKGKSDIEVFEFLAEKIVVYKSNLKEDKD